MEENGGVMLAKLIDIQNAIIPLVNTIKCVDGVAPLLTESLP